MKPEDFYGHLDCPDCCDDEERTALCPIGREMLLEVAEELPPEWQRELRRILRKEERKKEADANAEYYKPGGQFDWITGMSEEEF